MLQLLKRLAQRGLRNAQFAGKLTLDNPVARTQFAAQDGVKQL